MRSSVGLFVVGRFHVLVPESSTEHQHRQDSDACGAVFLATQVGRGRAGENALGAELVVLLLGEFEVVGHLVHQEK